MPVEEIRNPLGALHKTPQPTGKQGDFLGQASLGWQDLDVLPGEASRELNLTLGVREGVLARDQSLVQGTLNLLVEAPVIEVGPR